MSPLAVLVSILPGRHLPRTPSAVAFARPWPTTRRGFKLWLIAVIFGIKGLGVAAGINVSTTDMVLTMFTDSLPGFLHVTNQLIGLAITGLCAFALFMSYCHHGRDRYGYNAMTIVAAGWTIVFIVAPLSGAPLAVIQGGLTWGAVLAFILYSTRDPEPEIPPFCRPIEWRRWRRPR